MELKKMKVNKRASKVKVIKKNYRKNKEYSGLEYDELIFVGKKIGTTSTDHEFRVSKFKDGEAGFFINTSTQGNFILTPRLIIELKAFLSSGLEKF
jgi:hypothetical protein